MIGDVSLKLGRRVYSARLEYDSLIGRSLQGVWRRFEAQLSPPVGDPPQFIVAQTIENVVVEFDVPGRASADLILEVGPMHLRLRAAGRQRRSGDIGNAFDRSVDLPEPVDPDRVTATLEDGVLTVKMTKAAWMRSDARRVPVRGSVSPGQTD